MGIDTQRLERLAPLAGEWDMETSFAPAGAFRARATFEWDLGGRFLIQRTEIDHPDAPGTLAVIAADLTSDDGFTQHYFDSRGVVRLYAMAFDGETWELRRESPDFTTLDFAQRYVGAVSSDGSAIEGRWETAPPGSSDWQRDFDLTYRRVS